MQEISLDAIDRRLVHALQIEPRASWNELAPVIGVDASTLARRWARLRDEGIAWVTGHSTEGQLSLMEIDCERAKLDAVVQELQRDPAVYVLDVTSGSRDLMALVFARDISGLSDYALHRLGRLDGVRSVRTHLANETLIDGGSWRLRALDPAEAQHVRPPRPPRPRAAQRVPDDLRAAIEQEVWADGRAPIATIAERSGFAPQRVADALATLRARGSLRFRTDMARAASGWPIYAWYFVEAPAQLLEAARPAITSVPEVRLAFTAASRYNLILAVWLRRLADVNRFEVALESALRGARIGDRAVVLRIAKHMNQTVGADTRATGFAGPAASA
jgi:DNA-binding Lrp family transcriptional regulator